jgi:cellulose synthase/poly-beta-1,6-N-acetylglucosamine synthase-like glycosyltransferase
MQPERNRGAGEFMRRKEARTRPSEPPTFRINRQPISIVSGGLLKPPLLTFIVVNWNYGEFIGQTIDLIRGQDYPHFECLVVDNASTDDSLETIARHVGDDVRFTVEALPENMGQLGAVLWALKRTNGGFVCIVDADDFLFPNFASSHLQVSFGFAEERRAHLQQHR